MFSPFLSPPFLKKLTTRKEKADNELLTVRIMVWGYGVVREIQLYSGAL